MVSVELSSDTAWPVDTAWLLDDVSYEVQDRSEVEHDL